MKEDLDTCHGQKGHSEVHAVFEDYVPKRDDAGGGCKGYEKSDDAERDESQSAIGKKGEDEQEEKKKERCKRLQRQETRGYGVVPINILADRPEKKAQVGKEHTKLGQEILLSGKTHPWPWIVKEVGSYQRFELEP